MQDLQLVPAVENGHGQLNRSAGVIAALQDHCAEISALLFFHFRAVVREAIGAQSQPQRPSAGAQLVRPDQTIRHCDIRQIHGGQPAGFRLRVIGEELAPVQHLVPHAAPERGIAAVRRAGGRINHDVLLGLHLLRRSGFPGEFCIKGKLGIIPHGVPVVLRRQNLAGPQLRDAVCTVVGHAQPRSVQRCDHGLLFPDFFPDSVLLLRCPEGMILRQCQAGKGLAHPVRGFRAGIALHQRQEGPVEAQCRHAFVQEIIAGQELQQRTGGDAPCQSRIRRRVLQHEVAGDRAGRRKPVDTTASPHIGKAVAVKPLRIGLHQLIRVLLEALCQVRLVLIAVPAVPDRCVEVEGPAGIIVKASAVPVPAFARIISQNRLGVIAHDIAVNLIPVLPQEGIVQHIEQAPVLRNRRVPGIV